MSGLPSANQIADYSDYEQSHYAWETEDEVNCPDCEGWGWVASRCFCGEQPDNGEDECECGKPVHHRACGMCNGQGTIIQ